MYIPPFFLYAGTSTYDYVRRRIFLYTIQRSILDTATCGSQAAVTPRVPNKVSQILPTARVIPLSSSDHESFVTPEVETQWHIGFGHDSKVDGSDSFRSQPQPINFHNYYRPSDAKCVNAVEASRWTTAASHGLRVTADYLLSSHFAHK